MNDRERENAILIAEVVADKEKLVRQHRTNSAENKHNLLEYIKVEAERAEVAMNHGKIRTRAYKPSRLSPSTVKLLATIEPETDDLLDQMVLEMTITTGLKYSRAKVISEALWHYANRVLQMGVRPIDIVPGHVTYQDQIESQAEKMEKVFLEKLERKNKNKGTFGREAE